MKHLLYVTLLCVIVADARSSTVLDKALTSSFGTAVHKDDLIVTLRGIKGPRRGSTEDPQLVLTIAVPDHHQLSLLLDRHGGKVVLESSDSGKVFREEVSTPLLKPRNTLDSLILELDQNSRHLRVYLNCDLIGEVPLRITPREMAAAGHLRAYRDRHIDAVVDWSVNVLQLLEKVGCGADGVQAQQANSIYTYRRGDMPSSSEGDQTSILVKTLEDLIQTIRDLQVEVENQREETVLLREAILSCEACKPGRKM